MQLIAYIDVQKLKLLNANRRSLKIKLVYISYFSLISKFT